MSVQHRPPSSRPALTIAAALLAVTLGACAPPTARAVVAAKAAPPVQASPPASPDAADAALSRRSALFDRLVADVRRHHLFAPRTAANLGKTWEDDLPRLRAEMLAAATPEALAVALHHFGNSLHDVHCRFQPEDRGPRLTLGVTVGVESSGRDFVFYVERVSRSADERTRSALTPGDVLVRVDGVAAEELVSHHDLESNMNSWTNIAGEVARFLTNRRAYQTTARDGATSDWVVRPRDGAPERTVQLAWRTKPNADVATDVDVDYATADCVNNDPKDYGPYHLTVRGYRACIYTSDAPRYRDYPIVRQVTFRYDEVPHGPLVDHALVASTLARLAPKGVILDVSENGGGINPNLFLEWWADKPYTDTTTRVLLDASLLGPVDEHRPRVSSFDDTLRAWYARELEAASPGQRLTRPRPFQCKGEDCAWENRYVPRHRVTTAPVALVVGPGCASSCDAVAWHFDRSDFGPIVGRPPMAGFTTHRLRRDVSLDPGGPRLGTLDLAVAYDTVMGDDANIEATPITIDVPVPRTFENHARYDALVVDRAIDALRARASRR